MRRKNRCAGPLVAASFRMLLALLIAAAYFPLTAAAQEDVARMSGAGTDIRKIVIADGIYQFMTMRDSYVRQLNSVVAVIENDVLVFDTNTRPSSARLILAEIRKITDKPVRYVVNSHWHSRPLVRQRGIRAGLSRSGNHRHGADAGVHGNSWLIPGRSVSARSGSEDKPYWTRK